MHNQTPQSAARNFCTSKIEQGFKPIGLHEYQDINGSPLYWRIRLKKIDTGEKLIWPMHIDNNGSYILKEPPFPTGNKPIYRQSDIANNPSELVYIHEGEVCADAFAKLGFIATTSGSWSSAKSADWSILSGRTVIIWPDSDENGLKYAENVAEILLSLGCIVWRVDIDKLSLPPKGDCIDWFLGKTQDSEEDIKILRDEVFSLPVIKQERPVLHLDSSVLMKDESQNSDSNKTTLLLELVNEVYFFHDEQKQPYASFKNNTHIETWPIDSNKFKDWLAHQFWKEHKKSIHDAALRDALAVMKGKAVFDGQCHNVFTRVGSLNGKIYINLANELWQVVEISGDGWEVLNESSVKFRGTQNMRSLPIPSQDGDINLLWKHINIPKAAEKLVLAWLLDCLIPNTPFPLLVLTGLQGSGKSRTQEILRNFVDPSVPNLRSAPKNSDDISIAAANNWLVSYNNVSKLSVENQDDLCCLSTGGGFARRRLYTTDEEAVVDIKRPVIINGIGDLITRQDLIDRCIIIDLPAINEKTRKSDNELDDEFKRDYPLILGGLLNVLSKVIRVLPTIQLSIKPRMASFALLGTALEQVLDFPKGSFTQEYKGNYQENMISALEGTPVAIALIKFMKNETQYSCTYGELLTKLSNVLYRPDMSAGWPRSAKGLANILKRQAPALEVIGIKMQFDEKPKNDGYHIHIIKQGVMYE